MIDMVQNAKDLIQKGKTLQDPDLVQMGMDLLSQYEIDDSDDEENKEPQYVCQSCGHVMQVDRPNRKKCPKCKKHKLVLEQDNISKTTEQQSDQQTENQKIDSNSFSMQVRGPKSDRIHYNDQGEPDGVIRKSEEIDPKKIDNIWQDDGEYRDDNANTLLKQFTKATPRTRQRTQKVKVECENCHSIEYVHPIHATSRGRYLCERCIRRRSVR